MKSKPILLIVNYSKIFKIERFQISDDFFILDILLCREIFHHVPFGSIAEIVRVNSTELKYELKITDFRLLEFKLLDTCRIYFDWFFFNNFDE
jgi:hypothetical protein